MVTRTALLGLSPIWSRYPKGCHATGATKRLSNRIMMKLKKTLQRISVRVSFGLLDDSDCLN